MKRPFKIIALALALVFTFALVLTACSDNAEEGDHLARIKAANKIIIATEGDWMPWTYHNEADELVGFDVELGQKIAEKLGVEVEFAETMWDSILAGVSSGRFDIACNGVGYTEERAESMILSKPYAYPGMVLVVRGDDDSINSFEDLAGKVTANTASSTYAQFAEQYGATVTPVDDLLQTVELLTAGRCDATINAEDTVLAFMQEHPEANIRIAAEAAGEQYVIPTAIGEDNESLMNEINKIIDELRESGELKEISEKYLGKDITAAE